MRILFFTHYFPPECNAPAWRVLEMCKRWVKAGHNVHVITCAPNVPNGIVYDGYKNRLIQREVINGIKTTRVWTYIAANSGTNKRIINYLSYLFSASIAALFDTKPDVVIATSPQFFCGWAGVIFSRLRRVPLILEIRDIWPDSIIAVEAMRNKRILHFIRWLEKKIYAAAHHIVTVGESYKQKLYEKGVRVKDVSVVPNGVDPKVFHPQQSDDDIRQRYHLDRQFICSYVGTIGMACGLDIVLRAAKRLINKNPDRIKFLLVGDGAIKNELEKRAAFEKLHNVIFTGKQDKQMVPRFLSISDACLVHLKKADLFKTVLPSKIFEAAAMARPIILGVEGFAADLLKQANAGISIEPENDEQLVAAVEMLYRNPNLRHSLGQAGRKYVANCYNYDNLAKDYLTIISNVCNS